MSCPICNDVTTKWLVNKNGFDMARCQLCGTVFVNPMPSLENLDAHYQNPAYFEGEENQGYRNYADMHKALGPHFTRRLGRLKRYVNGSLLDYGCADGYFLKLAREAGWQIAGVELAKSMAERASQELGVTIYSSVDRLGDAKFDAISLWEVIEHLPSPLSELQILRRHIRSGGAIMLSTPNAGHWQALDEPKTCSIYRPPSHLILYTATALNRLLQMAGFQRITIHRTMPLPPLPRWIHRVTASIEARLSNGQANPWLAYLITWRIIRLLGWGWQKLTRPNIDIFATLEAIAFCPDD
jgi:SAM-dependent methyltransferase